jgi:hypothetical protein
LTGSARRRRDHRSPSSWLWDDFARRVLWRIQIRPDRCSFPEPGHQTKAPQSVTSHAALMMRTASALPLLRTCRDDFSEPMITLTRSGTHFGSRCHNCIYLGLLSCNSATPQSFSWHKPIR